MRHCLDDLGASNRYKTKIMLVKGHREGFRCPVASNASNFPFGI
jgi:hypothetical protein